MYTHGGRRPTGHDALEWAARKSSAPADPADQHGPRRHEGRYDQARARSSIVGVPVIASGGVGNLEHIYQGLTVAGASAALVASIFHYGTHSVPEAKAFLAAHGVPVRQAP